MSSSVLNLLLELLFFRASTAFVISAASSELNTSESKPSLLRSNSSSVGVAPAVRLFVTFSLVVDGLVELGFPSLLGVESLSVPCGNLDSEDLSFGLT